MIHTAVILAAGLGTRFGKRTEKIPKGFIPAGGKPMVIRSIETLLSCGITRIIIGTGFGKEVYEALSDKYPGIECEFSPRYAETNSMYTLYNCRNIIGDDDFLLLESDIIYNKSAITALLEDAHPDIMLITPVTKFQDQYYVAHDSTGRLINCSTDKTAIDAQGELVGIHKLSSEFYKSMCQDYASKVEKFPKLGYEYELLHMSQHRIPLHVLNSRQTKWYEIDDEADLNYAEKHIVPYLD
jgi:2-aminoethylphosphonate-pyruvate transaminase